MDSAIQLLNNWDQVWKWLFVWKQVLKIYIFWCEMRSGFRELGGALLPKVPRSTPPGNLIFSSWHSGTPVDPYSLYPGRRTPYSGAYGEAPPERGAFFKLAVYYSERVTKSAAKWMAAKAKYRNFWQKWLHETHKSLHLLSNWTRTTETPGKMWWLQEILLFWLILEV